MGNDKSKMAKPIPEPTLKPNVSQAVQTTQNIRNQIDRLGKRQEFLEKKKDRELQSALARKNKGDKRGAVSHLKKKKMIEKEIEKLSGVMMTLETQAMGLESASNNLAVVNAMTEGKNLHAQLNKRMDIDDVADLTDDIRELMEDADAVGERLTEPIVQLDMDLEEDFLALDSDNEETNDVKTDVSLPTAPTSIPSTSLPTAPTHKPAISDDEEALRALEREMMAE